MFIITAIAFHANGNGGFIRTFQLVHCFLRGALFAYEGFAVNLHDLIASQHSSLLGRTSSYNVLHLYGIVVYYELYADAVEGAFQVIACALSVLCWDINGMRVKFCQYFRHGIFNEVVDIDCVNILVINDMQQIIYLVAAGINDVKTVA